MEALPLSTLASELTLRADMVSADGRRKRVGGSHGRLLGVMAISAVHQLGPLSLGQDSAHRPQLAAGGLGNSARRKGK